jgi:hypothetical protein
MTSTTEGPAQERNLLAADAAALAGLLLLILSAFWLIGPGGRVLAGGDLFSYFFPYWNEATQAIRAGELRLWNPHLFMGVPFLANSQVGALYPLNWPLWLLLPAHRSLHWSILLHLWIAASGVYTFAHKSLRLGRIGSWAAGMALALGGYLGAQVEHINQLQALAWVPWALTLYEQATNKRSKSAIVGLAAVVSLTLLTGHTQAAFISLLGLGVYALLPAPEPDRRPYWLRFAVLVGAAALGATLAAAQLLPTLELTSYSVRAGGLPFNERVSFSLSPIYLAQAILPGYDQAVAPENIEFVATIGASTILILLLTRRRWRSNMRLIYLATLGLFLALGLYNPIYLLLARFVPGFAHFRAPARWLALWAVGGAVLVGGGIESVARGQVAPSRRDWFICSATTIAIFVWGALGGEASLPTIAAWIAAAVIAVVLIWVSPRSPRPAALGLVALLLVELTVSARVLPHAQATASEAYTSIRPAAAHLLAESEGRNPPDRFVSLSALVFDPGDLAELRTIYDDQLSADAVYNLLVAAKHREVLSPNLPLALSIPAADGYDGGVLPLARYIGLQGLLLPPDEISLDGRLRENLTQVPDGRWLSLFNVRFIITDKVFDAWLDDVFYDLQFTSYLEPGDEIETGHIPQFEATALGLVSYLEGAEDLVDDTSVGQVTVAFADGSSQSYDMQVGRDTAEGIYGSTVAHSQATVGGHFWPGQPEGNDYVTRLSWDDGRVPTTVRLQATLADGQMVIRGASLIDERTGSFQSLVLSDEGRFRLAHSGDVKVYENLGVLDRAFIVRQAVGANSPEDALARLMVPEFNPALSVVLEPAPISETHSAADPAGEDSVTILSYGPERVELRAELGSPGYLVLSDAMYPGWSARVDGTEVEIFTADILFRAVQLEAGEHLVEFYYQSDSMRIGGLISLAGLVVLVGLLSLCVFSKLRPRRKSSVL